jgi:hypothetical protein
MTLNTRGPTGDEVSAKPAQGDILLFSHGRDDQAHLIGIVPGPPHLRFDSYERALSVAQALACERGAALWRTPDGETFTAVNPDTNPR